MTIYQSILLILLSCGWVTQQQERRELIPAAEWHHVHVQLSFLLCGVVQCEDKFTTMCYIIFCIPIQINNIRTILYVTITVLLQHALSFIKIWMRNNNNYYYYSIGTIARCGLRPVEQCPI